MGRPLRRSASIVPAALAGAALLLGACAGGGNVTTLSAPPTTDASLTLALERSPVGLILTTGTGAKS